jgi:hypothetical protein
MSAEITLLLSLLAVYAALRFGWPRLRHRLCHRYNWPRGEFVTWRRRTDHVLMVAQRCPDCGKLMDIRPSRISYRHMMRGDKFY